MKLLEEGLDGQAHPRDAPLEEGLVRQDPLQRRGRGSAVAAQKQSVEVEADHGVRPEEPRRVSRAKVEEQTRGQRDRAAAGRSKEVDRVAPGLQGPAQDRNPDECAASSAHVGRGAGDEEQARHGDGIYRLLAGR